MERPKKHGGSSGFHWVVANICRGDIAWVACIKCENPRAVPPFPTLEGVLATETGEDKIGGTNDGVHKSITADDFGPRLVLGHSDNLPPNNLGFIPNSARPLLNSSLTTARISALSLAVQSGIDVSLVALPSPTPVGTSFTFCIVLVTTSEEGICALAPPIGGNFSRYPCVQDHQ